MILSAKSLAKEIARGSAADAMGISIVPMPDIEMIGRAGEASVTLRLGRWFMTFRETSETHLSLAPLSDSHGKEFASREGKVAKRHFVPFGSEFVLHSGRFVLASTLEWIRIPAKYAAYVVGKSSLGRRGIVIETAAGIHPGFAGCITLEIANVGGIPIKISPGMRICQLFFHSVEGDLSEADSLFGGQRKPRLGTISKDEILDKLRSGNR